LPAWMLPACVVSAAAVFCHMVTCRYLRRGCTCLPATIFSAGIFLPLVPPRSLLHLLDFWVLLPFCYAIPNRCVACVSCLDACTTGSATRLLFPTVIYAASAVHLGLELCAFHTCLPAPVMEFRLMPACHDTVLALLPAILPFSVLPTCLGLPPISTRRYHSVHFILHFYLPLGGYLFCLTFPAVFSMFIFSRFLLHHRPHSAPIDSVSTV